MNAQAKPNNAAALLDLVTTTAPTGYLLWTPDGRTVRSLRLVHGNVVGSSRDLAHASARLVELLEVPCELRFETADVAPRGGSLPFEAALLDAARIADERSAA